MPSKAMAAGKSKYKVSFGRKVLFVGEKQQITFKGKKVVYKFKSSKKDVLSVNKKGVLKAKKKGKAKITITAYWRVKGKLRYKAKTYVVAVKNLKLKGMTTTLSCGENAAVRFNQDIGTRTLAINSSDSGIVSIENDYVRAVKPGKATISIKVGDYLGYTYEVTVTAKDLGTETYKLLVNDRFINGFLDLKSLMSKETGSDPISYEVDNPAKGEVRDGVYFATATGANIVKVYGGGAFKTFSINGIRWSAHRGYLDMRPENTKDAFITAGTSGAGMCETDLQVTADGEIVCLHDSTVNHMTNYPDDSKGYSVNKMTLEEVRQLQIDNGNGLDETTWKYVPTFEEYLQVMRSQQMIAVIELKQWAYFKDTEEGNNNRLEAMKKIYQQICRAGMQNRCIITSFYAKQLKAFCDANGDTNIPMGGLRRVKTDGTIVDGYRDGQSMGIPNLSSSQGTRFGTYSTMDYSPIIGRNNKSYKEY